MLLLFFCLWPGLWSDPLPPFFLWKYMCLSYPSCLYSTCPAHAFPLDMNILVQGRRPCGMRHSLLSQSFYFFCPTSVCILWRILFVCMYVCMYVCMCVYTHTHTHTHIYIYEYIFIYIYIYIYKFDCVEIVYQLPLLSNNMIQRVKYFYTNRERCEGLTGYLSLGRRPGFDWANTWHWTKRYTICFSNKK